MPRYIEKMRVPVRLALIGCEPVEGYLSLSPQAEMHEGPETILDRLNAPTRVVPFVRIEDGAVLLVVRAHIEWVAAGPDVAPSLVNRAHFQHTREEHVEVRLLGGKRHRGVLAIEMPHEFNRVSDFLNADGEFFPLQTPEGTLLFNKACLLDLCVRAARVIPKAA
jgi:hypothetical protein